MPNATQKFGIIVERDERRILYGAELYIRAAADCAPRNAEKPILKLGLKSQEELDNNLHLMERNFPDYAVYPVEAFPYIVDFAKWGVS
mgnify:CR=1 FL=1